MSELPAGTIIDGRYRVVSRLGSGGMADVFLAQDQQLGRNVALKLLHRRFAEDPGFVERFRREAQAAAGLQHPNVVGVYDRGDYDGTYYIAMEHLSGRSLKQLIREEAPLEPVRAVDITLQILKAARFAHRHGVIHRDLKPHNVIVDESDHVKVTDFGIARAGASDMTETGSIMGTAQYLSPEQAQGHAVSEPSDLYSVGVILYELLTGRVPFDAESAVTIALKHVSEAPTAPTQVNPSIPPALEEVVLWTLNKNPADRPRNADELIAALEAAKAAILSGRAGERTAAMAAVGGAGLLGAGGPPPASPADPAPPLVPPVVPPPPLDGNGAPPPDEVDPYAEEERRERRLWLWLALLLILLLAGGGAAAYFLTRPSKVTVPPVIGQPIGPARTILQNAGFVVKTISQPSRKKRGTVTNEIPNGGSEVKEGSTIQLTVSSGPGSVQVPTDLDGQTLAQATKALRRAGLRRGRVIQQDSSQFAPGEVITTSPPPGQRLTVGSPVQVYVSDGVVVPDVTGEPESQAKSDLHNAGFTNTNTSTSASQQPAGTVIDETPGGGTHAASSTTIDLVISQGPAKITVPTVTGQTASNASSQLQNDGFSVVERTRTVSDQSQDGIVIRQRPGPGAKLKKGSTVTIVVGHFSQPPPPPTTPTTPTTPTGPSGPTGATGP
jgi:beta-lactam-binding protein with PASTA domain/predicted Ser/Thr protein kinase